MRLCPDAPPPTRRSVRPRSKAGDLPRDYAAITGKGVWLREAASSSSRGIRTMDYEIVEVEDQGEEWWSVKTLRGEKGFVSTKFIASPVGYRAIFNKNRRGDWKLNAVLAGD